MKLPLAKRTDRLARIIAAHRTHRDRLPDRRAGENIGFRAGPPGEERDYTAILGFYPDWRLGEIFLSAGKSGSGLLISISETAIAASFAFQFGCPPELMKDAMPRAADGRPEGPLGMLLELLHRKHHG